ncbi:MAG: hypothetical protein ACKVXR_03860 [Planctomycetota bacterium]
MPMDATSQRLADNVFQKEVDRLTASMQRRAEEIDKDFRTKGQYPSSARLNEQRLALANYLESLSKAKVAAIVDAHRGCRAPIDCAVHERVARELRNLCNHHGHLYSNRLVAEVSTPGRYPAAAAVALQVALTEDLNRVVSAAVRDFQIAADKYSLEQRPETPASPPAHDHASMSSGADLNAAAKPVAELDVVQRLRSTVSRAQRELLDQIWAEYRTTGQSLSRTALHLKQGSPTRVQALLGGLGGSVVYENPPSGDQPATYWLTLLGALLTTDGERIEAALATFLEHARSRILEDQTVRSIQSQELAGTEDFGGDCLEMLQRAFRLDSTQLNLGGGSSSHGWRVDIPEPLIDVLLEADDLRAFVRMSASDGYDPNRPIEHTKRASYQFMRSQHSELDVQFGFVRDPALRRQLWSDWQEVQRVLKVKAWKACTVLCGSVIEGILYDALYAVSATYERDAPELKQPKRARLSDLVEEAKKRGILRGANSHLSHAIREFRNLIHPERQLDLGLAVSEEQAQIAVSSVRILIREQSSNAESSPRADEGDPYLDERP